MKLKKLTIFLFICLFTIVVNGKSQEKDFEKEFEEKYQAWKEYISQPEIMLDSDSTTRIECKEFSALRNLRIDSIPFMIEKMKEDKVAYHYLGDPVSHILKLKIESIYIKEETKFIYPDYPEVKDNEHIIIYWWTKGYKKTDSLFKKYYTLYVQSRNISIFLSQKSTRYYYFKIRDLGIQVIPLIIETAKKGDDDLLKLLPYLTNNNISKEKLSETKSREEKVKYCEEWWEENKEDWTIPFGD